jgi:hypothetical protein
MTNLLSSIYWYAIEEGDHSLSIWFWSSGSSLHMPIVVELLLESMGDGVGVVLLVIRVLEKSCCLLAVEKRSNP